MGSQRGFTILEVTLFIAISGLLLMVAMTGVNSSLQSNRMADATRSLESHLEIQLTEVRSGVVRQQTDASGKVTCAGVTRFPGASNECIIMGKVLVFKTGTGSEIRSYNVVGNIEPSIACNAAANGVNTLKQYCPRVLDTSQPVDTYRPEWGSTIPANKVQFAHKGTGVPASLNALAFVRDPASELVYVFAYSTATTAGPEDLRTKIFSNYTNAQGVICLSMNTFPSFTSYVLFSGGEGTGAIKSASDASLPGGLTC